MHSSSTLVSLSLNLVGIRTIRLEVMKISWIIATVLLLSGFECTDLERPMFVRPSHAMSLYNKPIQWWMDPGPWLKALEKLRNPGQKDPIEGDDPEMVSENLLAIINSYDFGIAVLAVAHSISWADNFQHLDPTVAYYHTTAYRWILRLLSLSPDAFQGRPLDMQKVWRRRYEYEDEFLPKWMRLLLPWVNDGSWDKEEDLLKKYNRAGKSLFDKYDRYPAKTFISIQESFGNSTSTVYSGPFTDE